MKSTPGVRLSGVSGGGAAAVAAGRSCPCAKWMSGLKTGGRGRGCGPAVASPAGQLARDLAARIVAANGITKAGGAARRIDKMAARLLPACQPLDDLGAQLDRMQLQLEEIAGRQWHPLDSQVVLPPPGGARKLRKLRAPDYVIAGLN